MTIALIIVGLAAAYLIGQLLIFWRSRNQDIPPPPPGGWKQTPGWDDEGDDWPERPTDDEASPPT